MADLGLAGAVTIVTGAGRGIGAAIARRFCASRAWLCDVLEDETSRAYLNRSIGTPQLPEARRR